MITPLADRIITEDQHSPEWMAARRGCATASRVAQLRDRKRGTGELESRRKLRFQLLAEILTDRAVEHYVTPAMEWGITTEPKAKDEYEYRTGNEITPIGFVCHHTLPRAGCSPDGWVKPNRFVEVKCPTTETHLQYLDGGVVPEEYHPQLLWQMACAGPEIEVIDFVSFDPRVDEKFQMFICPFERDEKLIAEWEERVEAFLVELNGMAERLLKNAKHITLESKLRESIRQARGKYSPDSELLITQADVDPDWEREPA